jgi:DDE superfamily endonuclease
MGIPMVIGKPLPFVCAFVEAVDKAIAAHSPGQRLSTLQRAWLAFCVTAILVTNSICWARFDRASLGTYSLAALSWMFRHAQIPWEHLLVASVWVILASYGIADGSLVIDDTDKQRSKTTTTLAHLYKLRDKESGGYIWGQSLVFLLLVTPTITIPMGFAFYQPAPELSAWYKEDKRRKQQGVPKQPRPPKPPPNPAYPTKQELALRLLRQCQAHHPELRVHCIVADALYGASTFVDAASAMFGGVQVISQLRSNQKVRVYKREQYVADYFTTHPGTPQKIRIRGGEEIAVLVGSARMYVCAHHTRCLPLAVPKSISSSVHWGGLNPHRP